MNYKMRALLQTPLIVMLFIGYIASASLAQENITFEDTVVLTIPHGHGLGKVHINCGSGGCNLPGGFTIDPNGVFYVVELNYPGKDIVIKTFSPDGKPLGVINIESIADGAGKIQIAANGDIYLIEAMPGLPGRYIGHYDKNGKLINRFGKNGELTKKTFNKIHYGDPGKDFVRNECFITSIRFYSDKNDIFVVETRQFRSEEKTFNISRYDTRSAMLLERRQNQRASDLPEKVKIHRNKRLAKLAMKDKIADKKAARKMGGYSIVAPDGEYYYMTKYLEAPTRMEIRKVVFKNDKSQ